MHCGYSTAQEARVKEAGEERVVVERVRKESPPRSAVAPLRRVMPSGRSWPTIETTSGGRRLLLGVLSAFAVWLGSAGFIGEVLDDGLALGVGLTRAIVPVALIGIGIGLVMGGKDDDTDSDLDRLARVAVGSLATLIAATGLLHVFRVGRPRRSDR